MPYLAASYARSAVSMTHAQVAAANEGPAAASATSAALRGPPPGPGSCSASRGYPPGWCAPRWPPAAAGLATDLGRAVARWPANPDFPRSPVPRHHSLGLLNHDAAQLADAAAQHADLWAQASAAEDLGVLLAAQASKDQAIAQLTWRMERYGRSGASADMARIRRRLRRLGVRRRHWTLPPTGR